MRRTNRRGDDELQGERDRTLKNEELLKKKRKKSGKGEKGPETAKTCPLGIAQV